MSLSLPVLPYSYDALAPYMSAETLEFHHDKHHQAYVDNANKLAATAGMTELSLEEMVRQSHGKDPALFNNAAQHFNHLHFWSSMKKGGGGAAMPERLTAVIHRDLGGYDAFRAAFMQAGLTQFGSGWAWLSVNGGKLEVTKSPNGENPLIHGATPILGCDVWEHAYYIDFRNARARYLDAFLDHLVDWEYVDQRFAAAN